MSWHPLNNTHLGFVLAQEEEQVASSTPPTCEDVLKERIDCYDSEGPCEFLPIPPTAFGSQQVDPTKGYMIQTIREHVYAIGEGSYWMMVAIVPHEEKRTLRHLKKSRDKSSSSPIYDIAIFDFPEGGFVVRDESGQTVGSLITNALDELVLGTYGLVPDEESLHQVTMVYSHQHFDHIGAASIVYQHISEAWMPAKIIEIIGHAEVEEEFLDRTEAGFFSFRAPLPTKIVENDEVEYLQVGSKKEGLTFSLTPVTGHTADKDLVIFLERDETTGAPAVMMYIDVIFPGWAPFFSFAITTDLFSYLESHKTLMEDFDLGEDGVFIGGHLSKLGGLEDIRMSYAFAQSVMDGALMGLQQANVNAIAGANGIGDPNSRNLGNSWLLFDLYFKEVVRICAKHVVTEWGCKLGAVDVVVDSHCRSAQSYWRVDF